MNPLPDRRSPESPDRRRVPRGGRRAGDWPGRWPCILIVDADSDGRDLYGEYLSAFRFDVQQAADGEEALRHAVLRPPQIVVTELRLPRLDGSDLVQRLRADPATRGIPVIVLTSEVRRPEIERVRRAGVDAVLTKPCLPDRLLEEIRRTLGAAGSF